MPDLIQIKIQFRTALRIRILPLRTPMVKVMQYICVAVGVKSG